jgi:carbon monoxide dehydrogenase subunit G
MSHTTIQSETLRVEKPIERVFNFLSDFNNFEKLMPAQVKDWKSTGETCQFAIPGLATIGMKIVEKQAPDKIVISSDGKVPFNFTLTIKLQKVEENVTEGNLVFDAEMNPFMKMMVEKPLTNFFNMLASKVKDVDF